MYNSHDLAISIKKLAKQRGVSIKEMLAALGIGSNTMSALYHGKAMAYDTLARIADYLDCSIDYLLGRSGASETENKKPAPSKEETEIFSEHEIKLVYAYRSKPEMQPSIDKLLDIENYANSISEDVARTLSNVPQNINTD